ncbi:MAG: hypothetical protein ABSF85_10295 [Terriglobales bacterium]|jgi:hypothetical protein
MSTYSVTIRRCQHIKVNGIQCGSPAMRKENYCFFHEKCRVPSREINMRFSEAGTITLPTLEDANSIQLGLGEVMRLLVTKQIDHKTASLLLHALRTAAANVKFTSLEPKPTHIVIDRHCVENRPLGATAWSTVEGRDYDLIENDAADKNENKPDQEGLRCMEELLRLTVGVARDPNYLDRTPRELAAARQAQSAPPFSKTPGQSPENRP